MPTKEDLARVWAEKKAVVRIGKSGLVDGIVEEVIRQLKKQRIIKVRFLRTATVEMEKLIKGDRHKFATSEQLDQKSAELEKAIPAVTERVQQTLAKAGRRRPVVPWKGV